jgi:hypothetical protein
MAMSRFSEKEADLVRFLRQHRPSPPAVPLDLEPRLLARIQTIPQVRRRSLPWQWLIPASLILAALAIRGGGQRLQSASQFAPVDNIDAEKIEAFMVENWQATVGDLAPTSPTVRSSVEWVTLTDSETRFQKTQP